MNRLDPRDQTHLGVGRQTEHDEVRTSEPPIKIRIFAHNVRLPANVGGLFRLADAFGVERLHLSGDTPIPPNTRLHRAARSCERWVSFRYESDPLDALTHIRKLGYTLVALEHTTQSYDLYDLPSIVQPPICWVLGSEDVGINEEFLKECTAAFHIQMFGRNSSMNVSCACACALFATLQPHQSHPSPQQLLHR